MQTVISQFVVTESGVIEIQFEHLDAAGKHAGYHRTTLNPGVPLANQLALVNDHLAKLGRAKVRLDHVEKAQAEVDKHHTPARVAAFKAERGLVRHG